MKSLALLTMVSIVTCLLLMALKMVPLYSVTIPWMIVNALVTAFVMFNGED